MFLIADEADRTRGRNPQKEQDDMTIYNRNTEPSNGVIRRKGSSARRRPTRRDVETDLRLEVRMAHRYLRRMNELGKKSASVGPSAWANLFDRIERALAQHADAAA